MIAAKKYLLPVFIAILLQISWAGNEVYTVFPSEWVRSNFWQAYVAIEPLAGEGRGNGITYSWPGFLHAVFIPAQAEGQDFIPPAVLV